MALFTVEDWEMPNFCAECRFRSWVMAPGGQWHYGCGVTPDNKSLGSWQQMHKKRANFCPLVEAEPICDADWIYGEDESGQDGIFCSACSHFVPWYYEYFGTSDDLIENNPRCPKCGAYMR